MVIMIRFDGALHEIAQPLHELEAFARAADVAALLQKSGVDVERFDQHLFEREQHAAPVVDRAQRAIEVGEEALQPRAGGIHPRMDARDLVFECRHSREAYNFAVYRYVLLLHILGACVWAGGHLVLAIRIFPGALRARSARLLLDFEQRYEALGMTALAVQIATGLWLAARLVPPSMWFSPAVPASQMIMIKFGVILATASFAIDARFRVLPRMSDDRVATMRWHITSVTILAVIAVAAGVGIRTGGWW